MGDMEYFLYTCWLFLIFVRKMCLHDSVLLCWRLIIQFSLFFSFIIYTCIHICIYIHTHMHVYTNIMYVLKLNCTYILWIQNIVTMVFSLILILSPTQVSHYSHNLFCFVGLPYSDRNIFVIMDLALLLGTWWIHQWLYN